MLEAFRSCVNALPAEQQFMVTHGILHRGAKTGSVTGMLMRTDGEVLLVLLDQGNVATPTESFTLRQSILTHLKWCLDPTQGCRSLLSALRSPILSDKLLVVADIFMATDEQEAAQVLGFDPLATVFFLGCARLGACRYAAPPP